MSKASSSALFGVISAIATSMPSTLVPDIRPTTRNCFFSASLMTGFFNWSKASILITGVLYSKEDWCANVCKKEIYIERERC